MEKLISFLDLRRMKSDPRPCVPCAEGTAGLAASGAGPLRTEVRGQQRPAPHPQMVPGTGSEVGGGGSATEALLARLFCLGPPLGAAVPDQAGRVPLGSWAGAPSAQRWEPGSGRLAATFQKEYGGKNQSHIMYAKFFILH